MKRLLNLMLVLVALVAIGYPFRDRIRAAIENLYYVPCARPITYTLGTFDARFGISKESFLSAIQAAAAIWEKPTGKDLFAYAPADGDLKINLVFDYRELATTKLAAVDTTLKGDQAAYDALKSRYADMKAQYAQSKSDYDARVASFNARNADYEKQVEYWNSRGGATPDAYAQIESERKALEAESTALQQLQAEINGTVNEINSVVGQLNSLATSLNLKVDAYNTIDASRGESFEQGLYQSDGVHQKIDIYEFSDRDKLVRVLAHELGHALGLGHVADPNAIMYSVNQGTSQALAKDDLAALKAECKL